MPKIIQTYGFYLPNGRFEPNEGGHSKSAWRFCQRYPELANLKESKYPNINFDDFLLMAGCAAVAGSRGKRCLRIAAQNPITTMKDIVEAYTTEGFEIHDFWELDSELLEVLNGILDAESKKCIIEETIIVSSSTPQTAIQDARM